MSTIVYISVGLLSYLLGSIPCGFIAGTMTGVDVRRHGSGNIGATNVLRVIGKKYGIAVFLADSIKGFVAVRIALWIGVLYHLHAYLLGIIAAVLVILGHAFPIWLRFHGGKGVATSGGACLGLLPAATLVVGGVWIITFFAFRFVSLASIIAVGTLPLGVWLLAPKPPDPALLVFSVVVALFVIVRHRSNIARLVTGTEPRFNRK